MKKLPAICLVIVLCLSMVACGIEGTPNKKPSYEEPDEETKAFLYEYYIHVWNLQEGGYWDTATEEELPVYISGQALYREVYAFLQGASAVDEWMDSEYVKQTFEKRIFASSRQEILDRFTILEDVPLMRELTYTDALGNTCQEEPTHGCEYEANGVCKYSHSYLPTQHSLKMPTFEFAEKVPTYDAKGNATEVRYVTKGENGKPFTVAVDTYTYNADGTVATAHCLHADGKEYTAQYTYENGKVVRMAGHLPGMSDNAAAEVLYSYDGQGRLIEERQKYGNDSEQWERALLYTYEGDSLMPSTVVKVNIKRPWDAGDEKSYENIIRWQYTYKANGQPEGATIEVWENLGEIAEPETEGKRTLELKLTYGDYYFYNAEEN